MSVLFTSLCLAFSGANVESVITNCITVAYLYATVTHFVLMTGAYSQYHEGLP